MVVVVKSFEQLESGWLSCPAAGRSGTVVMVVARLGGGAHRILPRGELTVDGGLRGDRWSKGSHPSIDRQLTLMEARVARLVCDGQPLHMPGDNILVDLDLSAAAAPAGTRIQLGAAVVEVTDKPHTGCKKFEARFGADAMRWVNDPSHAQRRLRGINCRVIQPATIAPTDTAALL